MPSTDLTIAPLEDTTPDALARFTADVNTRMEQLSRIIAGILGEDGINPVFLSNVNMSGKRLTRLAPSKHDSDAVTRGEIIRLGLFRRSDVDPLRTDAPVFLGGGVTIPPSTDPNSPVTLSQIQAGFSSATITVTGLASVGSLTVGGGATITTILKASAALNFPNTAAQTSADLTIAVPGAADGDAVILGVPNVAADANTAYSAWVSAADTVSIRFNNYSAAAVNPASGTFTVWVIK